MTKEAKGWPTDPVHELEFMTRDQHKLCIEDPFQLDYNVARTVTTDGLYTIRGEFIRAYRILISNPNDRVVNIVNEVCEEREDFLVPHPPPSSNYNTGSAPSPRRRSAPPSGSYPPQHPSPNMYSAIPPITTTQGMEDFRIWAAKNGVNSSASSSSMANSVSALDTSVHSQRGQDVFEPTSPGYPHAPQRPSPLMLNAHFYTPSGISSNLRRPLHQPMLSQQPGALPDALFSRSQPNSIPCSPPWMERRVSWDGAASTTPTGTTPVPAPTVNGGGPPAASGYDLHKSFQNQRTEPPATSIITTPTMSQENQFQFQNGPGRSPYRYATLTEPRQSNQRILSASLPPRPPYPFPSSSLPSTPSHYYQQPQHSAQPFAIFPIEDRETIIQANSITFGNFDSTLPNFFPFPYPHIANSIAASTPTTVYSSPLMGHSRGLRSGLEDHFDSENGERRGRRLSASGELDLREHSDEGELTIPHNGLHGIISNGIGMGMGGMNGSRARGRSMPQLVRLSTVTQGGEGKERDIALVKFGEVETEFFLPFFAPWRPTESLTTTDEAEATLADGLESLGMEDRVDAAAAASIAPLIPVLTTIPPTPIKGRYSAPVESSPTPATTESIPTAVAPLPFVASAVTPMTNGSMSRRKGSSPARGDGKSTTKSSSTKAKNSPKLKPVA